MTQTPFEYYENEENYGKYQYVTLSEIVNNIMLKAQIDDSIIKNMKRSSVLAIAKDGIRDLTQNASSEDLGIEITVPDNLVWPLPQDYVHYSGIYVVKRNTVTGSFNLYELDIDYNIHTSIGYLQDHNADILFDSEGGILEADSSNAINHPYHREQVSSSYKGNNPTKDTSKYSKHGLFTINKQRGVIVFSSDLADKEIVIKYKSDGLQNDLSGKDSYVHKDLKVPIQDYIIWQYLSIKDNVSQSRINSARNKYLASRHQSVISQSDFNMHRILKHADSTTKLF